MIIVHTLLIPNNITSNNSKVYKNLIQESLFFFGKGGCYIPTVFPLLHMVHPKIFHGHL